MGLLMGTSVSSENKLNSSALGVTRPIHMDSVHMSQIKLSRPGSSPNEEDSFDKISRVEDDVEDAAQKIVDKRLSNVEYHTGF
jgi:hypothetical protein